MTVPGLATRRRGETFNKEFLKNDDAVEISKKGIRLNIHSS
jgi:hypothetical protein